ncbi:nudix hydrolase 8 isoform X1 [Vigna radiata var. radiata]|uniref:Nudix hydrolase 8 isoform X1 n=1 Tax=Vigna radiata var. radiata TaxID=3916 RepID=A0A1S3VQK8_VIGRR|nr:nudix hydrolase 8 isoform X1 [Vigna radiata var. radiata]
MSCSFGHTSTPARGLNSFSSNSACISETVNAGRTTAYSSLLSNFSSVRFSRQLNCFGGLFLRNYEALNNIYMAHRAVISSVGRDDLAAETSFHRMNGINGSTSSLGYRNLRVLDAFDDVYEGIVVDSDGLPDDPNNFEAILRFSLSHWKKMGKKGIWLRLPLEKSDLVPIAIKEGFGYHHAEPGYVMLTYWIPEGPCMLPFNASHHVGVGGFVINHRNEVLVVQEKYCAPANRGLWKIPTGFVLQSEEIYEGAVREVKEETGICTEFIEVIAFRHAHKVAFEKSDLFFICMLRPLSAEITVDDPEIEAAKWMPLVEFVEQPLLQEDSMFKKIINICIACVEKRYSGLSAHHMVSKFDGKSSSLYYNVINMEDINCLTQI